MNTTLPRSSRPLSIGLPVLVLCALASCGGGGGGGGSSAAGASEQALCLDGTWNLQVEDLSPGGPCSDLGLDGAQIDFTALPSMTGVGSTEGIKDLWLYYVESDVFDSEIPGSPVTTILGSWSHFDGAFLGLPEDIQRLSLFGAYYIPAQDITVSLSGEGESFAEWSASTADCDSFETIQEYEIYQGNAVLVVTDSDGFMETTIEPLATLVCSGKARLTGSRSLPLLSSAGDPGLTAIAGALELGDEARSVPLYGFWSEGTGSGYLETGAATDGGARFEVWLEHGTMQINLANRAQLLWGSLEEDRGVFEGKIVQISGDGTRTEGVARVGLGSL